ncbi:energy transducer TonB [Stenotrophomonas mori]|uniref:Protein TonB n=1 Tax=Stenotrophomonas mori TaxID=2871096 RepID=A0ABT0SF22_9GAMM|nr:energy transducer TonB [Stenotrophomonas mori]MCL7713920.1 TonB family protein [Stenotrophomonas mori]
MSASRSDAPAPSPLPPHSLKIAGLAFCAGLLLFLVVWLNARRHDEAPAPDPALPQQAEAGPPAPLPEPLPAASGASEMPDARAEQAPAAAPEAVDTTPPPPQPLAEAPAAPPPAPAPTAQAASDRPVPLPGHSPPPTYPPAALRRGESGTVVVRVDVDAGGRPLDARIIQRSGSRELDRAALAAVRGWRFEPARSNGQPMVGSLEIPFDFQPAQ